jgi:hypothetical protein
MAELKPRAQKRRRKGGNLMDDKHRRDLRVKGKRLDNGEYVTGWYVCAMNHWHDYGIHEDWIIVSAYQNGGWFALGQKHAVDPNTIEFVSNVHEQEAIFGQMFDGGCEKFKERWENK